MFDMHVHTDASHDSEAIPGDIVRMASGIGLEGLAFTDHFDNYRDAGDSCFLPVFKSYSNYLASLDEAERLGVKLLFGLEAGEGIRDPQKLGQLAGRLPFDVIIGSVHEICCLGENISLHDFDFKTLPPDVLRVFVETYYRDLYDTMNTCGADVCAHIDLIDRYIAGKHGIRYDRRPFREHIEAILRLLVSKNIALEVNTSTLRTYGFTMPGPEILKTYRRLGGVLLTLGSDAHVPSAVGRDFSVCLEMIKSAGFKTLFYYSKRTPVCDRSTA